MNWGPGPRSRPTPAPRFSSQICETTICDYRHATTAGTLPISGTKWYWNGNTSRVVREHISHLGKKNGKVERDCISIDYVRTNQFP